MTASTADVLRAARALVATPSQWWQYRGHRGVEASRSCAGLALAAAEGYPDRHCPDAWLTLASAAGLGDLDLGDVSEAIYDWNDAPERTHAEVLAAFDRAIAAAEAAAC